MQITESSWQVKRSSTKETFLYRLSDCFEIGDPNRISGIKKE